MTKSLRKHISEHRPRTMSVVSHAGLVMDRYLAEIATGGENRERTELLNALAESRPPAIYSAAYKRWKNALVYRGAIVREFETLSRVVVGLSSESVTETSLRLHKTYGTPLINGDALKGLVRHYFNHQSDPTQHVEHKKHAGVLFGDTKSASYLRFYDAWYIPDLPDNKPLKRDVITVHHPRYYTGSAPLPPTDFDDPIPVPFLSVSGSFLIAVDGPTPEWTTFAMSVLERALADYGVGAKTNSGYGRLVRVESTANRNDARTGAWVERPSNNNHQEISQTVQRILALSPNNVKGQIDPHGNSWMKNIDDPARQQIAEALRDRLRAARIWEDPKWRQKLWVQFLVEYLAERG